MQNVNDKYYVPLDDLKLWIVGFLNKQSGIYYCFKAGKLNDKLFFCPPQQLDISLCCMELMDAFYNMGGREEIANYINEGVLGEEFPVVERVNRLMLFV
jgi:hypothetical protein